MKYESETLRGLKKACSHSKRDGKWSTVSETRDDSKGIPMNIKIRPILIQLCKESRAEKKKGHELYRPAGGGWGGGANTESFNDRTQPSGRQPSDDNPRDTLGDAIGIVTMGGMAGGAAGGGRVPTTFVR